MAPEPDAILLDVLRQLGVVALDGLVNALRDSGSLSAARLTCRCLRDIVDGSVSKIVIGLGDDPLSADTPTPSLTRWPRCSSVSITFTVADGTDPLAVSAALTRPFTGLPAEQRRRITHLSLWSNKQSIKAEPWGAEAAVSSLAAQLPALRKLDLSGLHGWSFNEQHLHSMYRALSALPHLENLVLPDCHALDQIGQLASGGTGGLSSSNSSSSSLRRLEVKGFELTLSACSPFTPQLCAGLASLNGLQKLVLKKCAHLSDSFLLDLMRALPLSLRLLCVRHCWHFGLRSWDLALCLDPPADQPWGQPHGQSNGRVVKLLLKPDTDEDLDDDSPGALPYNFAGVVEIAELAALAESVLLPGLVSLAAVPGASTPPSQPLVAHLRVGCLTIRRQQALTDAETAALRSLRRRCGSTQLGTLHLGLGGREDAGADGVAAPLDREAQLAALELALELFGPPEQLAVEAHVRMLDVQGEMRSFMSRKVYLEVATPPEATSEAAEAEAEEVEAEEAEAEEAEAEEAEAEEGKAGAEVSAAASAHLLPAQPGQRSAVLTPESLAPLFFQAAFRLLVDDAPPEAEADAGIGTGAGTGADDEDEAAGRAELLPLSGSFIALLSQTPHLLEDWVRWLEQRAKEHAIAEGGDGGGGAEDVRCIRSFQVLPSAGAVLLCCEAQWRRSVVAAVEAAAASAAATAGAAAAAPLAAGPVLRSWRGGLDSVFGGPVQETVLDALEEVLQDTWDGLQAASGAGGGGAGGGGVKCSVLKFALLVQDVVLEALPPVVLL